MKEIYLGADCGESQHYFSLLEDGREARSFRLANREEDLREGLVSIGENVKVNLVLEGLYSFSFVLSSLARELGFVVWQVNPKALDHYRDLEGQPRKTDALDAFLLARMAYLEMKGCRRAVEPSAEEQELRALSRLHGQLSVQRTEAKLRIRSRLLELAPEICDSDWEGPAPTSGRLFAVLRRWPGFMGLEKARQKTVEDVIKRGPGKANRSSQAAALKAMAAGLPENREPWSFELSLWLAQHDMLDQQVGETNRRIVERNQAHPIARKLTDIPGIAHLVAAVLVGELAPLTRTSSEAQVATYAGLTPTARRSGQSGRDIFSRGTNKHALHACFMSAIASLRCSPLDRAYYDKQRRSHQGHPKAHVVATLALARQRHKLIYKLMTTAAEYDPDILLRSHLEREAKRAA